MNNAFKSTYGLIGYPLEHSLSPQLHNTAFQALDVEAVYQLFSLQEKELKDFFQDLRQKNSAIFGLNVTVPYKEIVIPFLDSLDVFAEKVGAVNTIVVNDQKKLIGYNTDGPGFLAHLTEMKFNPSQKRIGILGAGGAARALLSVFCLLPETPQKIKVFARNTAKAQQLLEDLSKRMNVSCIEIVSCVEDLDFPSMDLLINTTPVGLNPMDSSLVPESLLHANLTVYDLIYNPSKTKLLALAENKGAQAVNGLRMLYYQGVLAFQRWAEMELPEDVKEEMWQALRQSASLKETI